MTGRLLATLFIAVALAGGSYGKTEKDEIPSIQGNQSPKYLVTEFMTAPQVGIDKNGR